MPISFIVLSGVIVAMLYYKKFPDIKVNKMFLLCCILFFLTGYFIEPIDINYIFNVNVIFSFLTVVIGFYVVWQQKVSRVVITVVTSIVTACIYVGMGTIFNDTLTFYNYVPMFIITTLISVLFSKHCELGLSYVMLSFFLIEVVNLLNVNSNVGYLTIFSVSSVNYMIMAMFIFSLCHVVYDKLIQLNFIKIRHKGGKYEK